MKLIIDIPDDYMKYIDIYEKGSLFDMALTKAVKNGTPIPDNATNGDVIKALFPYGKVIERDEATGYEQMLDDKYSYCSWFDSLWWNSKYEGGKEHE